MQRYRVRKAPCLPLIFSLVVHAWAATHARLRATGASAASLNPAPSSNSTVHFTSEASNATGATAPVGFAVIGDKCGCRFLGLCSCAATVEFLDCITNACLSKACECQQHDYAQACNSMAATCPSAGLQCTAEKATCVHEPPARQATKDELVRELVSMREVKCKLQESAAQGYVEDGKRLQRLRAKIQGHLDMLKTKEAAEPVWMGCGPPPVPSSGMRVSWVEGEAEPAPPAPTVVRKAAETMEPGLRRSWIMFINVTVFVVLFLLFAFVYDRFRMRLTFPQRAPENDEDDSGFSFGFFDCFSDLRLFLLSCCCLWIRWADTVDKANDENKFYNYWPAIGIILTLLSLGLYISLASLHPFTALICNVSILVIVVMSRQKLRRKYDVVAGSCRTIFEDLLAWWCCPWCAATQEARQVEAARDASKPASVMTPPSAARMNTPAGSRSGVRGGAPPNRRMF